MTSTEQMVLNFDKWQQAYGIASGFDVDKTKLNQIEANVTFIYNIVEKAMSDLKSAA